MEKLGLIIALLKCLSAEPIHGQNDGRAGKIYDEHTYEYAYHEFADGFIVHNTAYPVLEIKGPDQKLGTVFSIGGCHISEGKNKNG